MAALLLIAAACSSGHRATRAVISVSPRSALLDAPVSISVTGLPHGKRVTLRAESTDVDGVTWSSSAIFAADRIGRVSTAQPSLGGSYTGSNAMGLFEMQSPAASPHAPSTLRLPPQYRITITALVGGRQLTSMTVDRLQPSQVGVTERNERPGGSGIYADLYLPKNVSGRRPAVLVFGGSEGGLSTDLNAALLAAHGYPALALAYFDEPGLPGNLQEIPLEYFAKALHLLAAQPEVDARRVLTWGISRGSEAALLLGVHYPALVHGVIASVPSSVVNPGLPDESKSAWSLAGKPVADVPRADFGQPAPPDAPDAIIPVEKVAGPILLVCGGLDQIWPSCDYSDAIEARVSEAHGHNRPVELRYDGAGHFVASPPYLVATAAGLSGQTASGTKVTSGGTVASNAEGAADAWPKLLAFVARTPS